MKTCYISRYGAYGDLLHCSHLPRLVKEHYGVDYLEFETGYHGCQILQQNPYIDKLTYTDTTKLTQNLMLNNWKYQKETHDLFFNLVYTIERSVCLLEMQNEYYRSTAWRREHCGKMSFWDVMTKAVDLPEKYYGTRGTLYYPEEEHQKAKEWISRQKDKFGASFLILVILSGSSLHKRFQQAEEVCRNILDTYPDAMIVLTGNKDCLPQVFEHPRVLSVVDKFNFRTISLISKYVDLTIGPETGLTLVSHSWDTPTIHLLTAASRENHLSYALNAYGIQSEADCSPCHKGPYKYYGCPRLNNLPACVYFSVEKIMNAADVVLKKDAHEFSAAVASG